MEIGGLSLNQRDLLNDIMSGCNERYLYANNIPLMDMTSSLVEVSFPDHLTNLRTSAAIDLSTFEIYSEDQLLLVQPFIEDLLSEEGLNLAKSKAVSFQQSIINSSLSYDEKIQLLTLCTGIITAAEFVEKGGIDLVANELGRTYFPNGRIQSCSVSSRNVLASAVIGLAGGAATGGYAGASVGTFTVPVLGTVAGGVGGAVFGGAAGFVSGLVSGVAGELLTSCGR
ncbi:hypothetical protein A3SI_04807 [Nitritalea halalkaliphila LW7]|uniref:Uncharacterized protein n=1 Tax=Nitritalea halalkaliphila LW7 TaxID=1189621 RepID=I5C8E2_9BACT|nr:hypothetical protein [Nitritalea halalkaliphila]EIM78094.1 hypothetical protein A3SI_04807 [Nitritalea halalkaliphila LW7]